MNVLSKDTNSKEITNLLINNKIVIMATDTVFGFVWKPSPALNQKIIEIKKRPVNKDYVYLSSKDYINQKNFILNDLEQKIMAKWWPGPITMIIKTIDHKKKAIRVPLHTQLQEIISATKMLASSSCNYSGKAVLTNANNIMKTFNDQAIYLLLPCQNQTNNKASTIIEVTDNKINFLREGIIEKEIFLKKLYK